MNISATGSGSSWFTTVNSGAPKPGYQSGGLEDRLFESGPESIKNLTKDDRDVILETTGIDIRDNGEIGMPATMTAVDYGTAVYGIQELAASRSRGQTASLGGSDFLQALAVQGYTNSARLNVDQYQGIDFRA